MGYECKIDDKIGFICGNQFEYFLRIKNVVGIGLGYKIIRGFNTLDKCITVLVEKKMPRYTLNKMDIIPKLYKGIKTDVVETGVFRVQSLIKKVRPVLGGYSIGNVIDSYSGTMGCLVTDGYYKYILSNNHVLASMNKAPLGTFIIQPSLEDKGKPTEDVVGILSKFIEIKYWKLTKQSINYVDCAIGKLINPSLASAKIKFIGMPKGIIIPILGERVKKVGRTTEMTFGKIVNTKATLGFTVDKKVIVFKDQILSSVIADFGDSGSVVLDDNNYIVGLHMGMSEDRSIVNPIKYVLQGLNVRIVTD